MFQQIEEDILLDRLRLIDQLLFHRKEASFAAPADYQFEYDDHQRVITYTHIDAQGQACPSHIGYIQGHCQYKCDRRGRIRQVTVHYTDTQGHPMTDVAGQVHVVYTFDTQRRVTMMDWRNADGFGTSADNVSRMLLSWDNEILRVRYFDNHDQLTSHYQYVFDETRQFIRLRMGLDDSGMLTTDDDGGNGSWIERDPHTRQPIALWNINIARQRIRAVDGVAYWRITFLPPYKQRFMYFNANGVAMTNHEGTYGFETEYDVYGNLVSETFLDADGCPMSNNQGIVSYTFVNDTYGRTLEVHSWGVDHKPVENSDGVHSVIQTYDDTPGHRTMITRKYDAQGNAATHPAHKPFITCYISARETLQYTIDDQGNLAPNSNGISCFVHRRFDDCGRLLSEYNEYANRQTLAPVSGDVCGFRYEHDPKHRQIQACCIGDHLQLLEDSKGVATYITQIDRWGRQVRMFCLDINQQPVANDQGDCGIGYEYDDEGNLTFVSLGADGRPHPNLKGYTYYSVEKDSFGRDVRELWFDAQRRPFVSSAGDSGLMTVYQPHGKEVILLDANGDPHTNHNGVAIVHYEYDEKQREVLVIRYDLDGEKVMMPEGYHALRTEYHTDLPNHRTLICLDADDHPVNTQRGCAYLEQWLDDKDEIIREMRFDADHLPAVDEDGVCGNTFRILDPVEPFGRSEMVGQLDANGLPIADDDTGLAYWQIDADVQGRVVRKRWFDLHEQPCRDSSGTYGVEFRYHDDDPEGIRPCEQRFISRTGRLMNTRLGFASYLIIYDVNLDCQRIYFDKSGKFVHYDPEADED